MSYKPIGILVLLAALFLFAPKAGAAPSVSFNKIATHPQATLQSTEWGKTLTDLKVYQGKLYASYGDYNANTGPIHVNPLDLNTNTFGSSLLSIPTEESQVIREINGKLFWPMSDPRLSWTTNVGYATNSTGTWLNALKAPAVHIFDMASLDETDLWMVGATVMPDGVTGRGATAYRSTDGGTTWNIAKVDQSSVGSESGYERYFWVANLNGKIYLQAANITPASPVRIFDGQVWTEGTKDTVCGAYDAGHVEVFAGKIVCISNFDIRTFDGETVTKVTDYSRGVFKDLYVHGEYIYAVGGTEIIRSKDGIKWATITESPYGAASIAIYDDYIYLGDNNAQLYKSNIKLADFWDTPVVTNISRTVIPVGESKVSIKLSGSNFAGITEVRIAGQLVATEMNSENTELSFFAPQKDQVGYVDLVVSNGTYKSLTLTNAFEYKTSTSSPEITSLSRGVFPVGGNSTEVTVIGKDFSDNSVVKVDGIVVPSSLVNDAEMIVTIPGSPLAKTTNLTIQNPNGKSVVRPDAIKYMKADYEWSSPASAPIGTNWRSVDISADAQHLIAATSVTQTSSNGGMEWAPHFEAGSGNQHTVSSSSDGKYLVSAEYYGYAHLSTDYGKTWQVQTTAGESSWISSTISDDGQIIFLGTSSHSLKYTTNGGQTWNIATSLSSTGVFGVTMSTDGSNVVVRDWSGLHGSTNNGATWTMLSKPPTQSIADVSLSADGASLVVADYDGDIYISNNLGTSWEARKPSGITSIHSVTQSSNGQKIFVTGQGETLYKSLDGGTTWITEQIDNGNGYVYIATDSTGENLLAGIDNGPLMFSSDSGETWDQKSADQGGSGDTVVSQDGKVVLAVDSGGRIFLSKQSGNDLMPLDHGIDEDCWEGAAMSSDGQKMVVAACDGQLYRSGNGGDTWALIANSPTKYWSSVSMSSDGSRIAAATYGDYVYISTDSGDAWEAQTSAGARYWESVEYAKSGNGLIAGDWDGAVYISSDRGLTLDKQVTEFSSSCVPYTAISADAKTLFAAECEGQIYKSSDAGSNWTPLKNAGTKYWSGIGLSSDGSKLVAIGDDMQSYAPVLLTSQNGGDEWYYHDAVGKIGTDSIDISGDGKRIIAVSWGKAILVGSSVSAPPVIINPTVPIVLTPNVQSPRALEVINKLNTLVHPPQDQGMSESRASNVRNLDAIDGFSKGSGISIGLSEGKEYSFSLFNDKKKAEIHRIIFEKINKSDDSEPTVTFTIHSNPITLTMGAYERKEVDITGDGINDLGVMVESINEDSASIKIWKLFQNVPEINEAIKLSADNVASTNKNSITPLHMIGVVLGVTLIITLLALYKRVTKKNDSL